MDEQREAAAIAAAVRAACLRAAQDGYERAASDGLCHEGAWEAALDAIRALDLAALLREREPGSAADRGDESRSGAESAIERGLQ